MGCPADPDHAEGVKGAFKQHQLGLGVHAGPLPPGTEERAADAEAAVLGHDVVVGGDPGHFPGRRVDLGPRHLHLVLLPGEQVGDERAHLRKVGWLIDVDPGPHVGIAERRVQPRRVVEGQRLQPHMTAGHHRSLEERAHGLNL